MYIFFYRKLYFLLIILTLSACKKKDICDSTEYENIVEANGPVSGSVNTDIRFDIFWNAGNECVVFSKFEEQINGNVYTIRPLMSVGGCHCNFEFRYEKQIYIFKNSIPGTYRLLFVRDGLNIEKNIVLQ